MTVFVLDNSVTMRWCFQNAAHPNADGVLQQLATGAALLPVLWRYEVRRIHQELEEAALHGPAGRIVNCLAPHTKAHPAALLLFLAAFGNLIGPGPHCMVESTRHALNLIVILVGDSSKARKGTSWNLIANLFAGVEPACLPTRVNIVIEPAKLYCC